MMPARFFLSACIGCSVALVPLPASASVQRGPDAHVVRQPRGDVLVVRKPTAPVPYSAPKAGWTYKPLRAGQRVEPPFYASRYVVAAPPGFTPARAPRRWVRYGDDLLLVNTRDGRVDRVVRGGYRLAYPRATR